MSLIKKMGLGIKAKYTKILRKLNQIKGTKESIAKGFATGAAMSFTPFVGFHILLSLIVVKLTKQNGLAAVLGTIVGNPWTFPFIWCITLHTGCLILPTSDIPASFDFKIFFSKLFHAIISLDFNLIIYDIWPIFLPMLIGCIPYYILVWFVVSNLIKKAMIKSQNKGDKNDIRTRV